MTESEIKELKDFIFKYFETNPPLCWEQFIESRKLTESSQELREALVKYSHNFGGTIRTAIDGFLNYHKE